MTKYILGVLLFLCLLFGYLSYHFYGEIQTLKKDNQSLVSSLQNCQENKEKAEANTKLVSDGMSNVLEENQKISKDFSSLQEELKKKRICNVYKPTQSNADAGSDQYVSDVVRLLSEGSQRARNGGGTSTANTKGAN